MFLALLLAAPVLIALTILAPIIAICSIPALLLLIYRNPLPPPSPSSRTRKARLLLRKRSRSSLLSSRKKISSANDKDDDDDDGDDGDEDRRQVILTGSYTGVGFEIAKECANTELHPDVGRIVLLARSQDKLDAAKEAILEVNPSMNVLCINATPYDANDMQQAAQEIFFPDNGDDNDNDNDDDQKDDTYRTTHLFCCTEESYLRLYQDTPSDEYDKLTEVNQLGCIYPVQAFLPNIEAGTVTLMSSLSGQMGVSGCSAYAPTEFALTGFAQCMHMELCYKPVCMQIAYPPDMEAPSSNMKVKSNRMFCDGNLRGTSTAYQKIMHGLSGLAKKLLAKMLNLHDPDTPLDANTVAKRMIEKAFCEDPPFAVYFTVNGWWLSTLTSGFAPCSTMFDAMSQVACMGLHRFVSFFFLQAIYLQIKDSKSKERNVMTNKGMNDDNDDKSLPDTENSFQI